MFAGLLSEVVRVCTAVMQPAVGFCCGELLIPCAGRL
jgi:hypothetical protein